MERCRKRLAPQIASLIPWQLWQRLLHLDLLLPYYHGASNTQLPHAGFLRTVRQFESDLQFLLKRYIPVSLDQVIDHLEGVRRLPKRAFHLTFDDGFREIYDPVAP